MRLLANAPVRGALGVLTLVLVFAALIWSRPALAQPQTSGPWVLDNVNVIDTRTGRVARRSAILIENGRIARVGPARSIGMPGVRRVDGGGAYVVPGYNDMHAHPLNDPDPRRNLQLMLANGITGYRQMSGAPPLLAARRAGRLDFPMAPQLLATPGMILTPANAATPEMAVAEVRAQREAGADFIKGVIMPPPAFFATLAEANRIGIPVAGHLPDGVDVRQAAQRGMRALEHLGGGQESLLLSCSREEDAIRQQMATAMAARSGPPPLSLDLNDPVALARTLANPIVARAGQGFARARRVVDTFDAGRCREVARLIARHGFWQVPTLIRIRTMQIADDPAYRNDPNLRFVPPATRELWNDIARIWPERVTAEDRATLARLFALQMQLVRMFDEAGVPMLAGSDFGGMWEAAGFSLHQEFDLLSQAGLSPLRILQMTTLNAGRFLNREATMGTVEAGRDADLVLLGANPVANHRNLHRISGVVRGGTYLSRQALDAIIEGAAQASLTAPAAPHDGH